MLLFKGLKSTHPFIRLLQIALAVTLIIGLIQLWQTSLLQGQLLLKSQTDRMVRLLVQQTAYGAAPALQLQNDQQLQWLTAALVEDPKVMAATIYNDQGQRLSFAQDISDEALDPDSAALENLLAPYPPYVESVVQDGKNLGYVEVRLDPKLFFDEIKTAHEQNMKQQQIMLLVAGVIGMLLSQALSFKRAYFHRHHTMVKRRRKALKLLQTSSSAAVDAVSHTLLAETTGETNASVAVTALPTQAENPPSNPPIAPSTPTEPDTAQVSDTCLADTTAALPMQAENPPPSSPTSRPTEPDAARLSESALGHSVATEVAGIVAAEEADAVLETAVVDEPLDNIQEENAPEKNAQETNAENKNAQGMNTDHANTELAGVAKTKDGTASLTADKPQYPC